MKKLYAVLMLAILALGMILPASATLKDERWRANQIIVEEDAHPAVAKLANVLSARNQNLVERNEWKDRLDNCETQAECDAIVDQIRESTKQKREFLEKLTDPKTKVLLTAYKVKTAKDRVAQDKDLYYRNKEIIADKKKDIATCKMYPLSEKCKDIKEEVDEDYKEYVKSGVAVFVAYLEKVRANVEASDMQEDNKDKVLDELDNNIAKFKRFYYKVDKAETHAQMKVIRNEIADFWKSVKLRLRVYAQRVENAPTKCYDTDGADYYEKGTVYYSGYKQSSDVCVGDQLSEAVCDGNTVGRVYFDCPYGCAEGRCLPPIAVVDEPTCSDSDGGNDIYEKGMLKAYTPTYGNVVVYDYCTDANGANLDEGDYVEELVCLSDDPVYAYEHERVECPYGCVDGACLPPIAVVPEPEPVPLPIPMPVPARETQCMDGKDNDADGYVDCFDTDCMDEVTADVVCRVDVGDQVCCLYDRGDTYDYIYRFAKADCQDGDAYVVYSRDVCEDYAEDELDYDDENSLLVEDCVDTDNGLDYKLAGTINYIKDEEKFMVEDECRDPWTLRERFCAGNEVKFVDVDCKTCIDGACI